MGIAEFGGNGSVNWHVDTRNAKPGTCGGVRDPERGIHRQYGVEHAPKGANFKIAIQMPKGEAKQRLLKELQRAADQKDSFTLTVPILRGQHEQIVIRWPSGNGRSPGR